MNTGGITARTCGEDGVSQLGHIVQNVYLDNCATSDCSESSSAISLGNTTSASPPLPPHQFVWRGILSMMDLRHYLDSEPNMGPGVFRKLQKIRQESGEIINGVDRNSEASIRTGCAKIQELCDLILTLCRSSPFSLPPMYKDARLAEIMGRIIGCLYTREIDICGTDNYDHYILGGVQGTGKTTVLNFVGVCASVLFRRVTPIAWDYNRAENGSAITRPVELVVEFARRFLGCNLTSQNTTISTMCSWLRGRNCLPLLMIDEVQCLLRKVGAMVDTCKNAIYDIHALARETGSYCIITGSSYRMRHILFRGYSLTDEWSEFPNFNASLFTFADMPALRNCKALEDYISVRYPQWKPTKEEIGTVLWRTGGIGRHIEVYHSRVVVTRDHRPEDFAPNRCNELEQLLRKCPSFGLFVSRLLDAHSSEVLFDVPLIGVQRSHIAASLQLLKFDVDQCIAEWVDSGCAYAVMNSQNEVDSVQLSIPFDVMTIRGNPLLHVELASIGKFFRFVTHVLHGEGNAGKSLEDLIRPKVHLLQDNRSIVFSSSILSISTGGALLVDGQPASIDHLHCKMFQWSGETELDGVWLEFRGADVSVGGWQCKCGHYDFEITGGSLRTSRNKVFGPEYCVSSVDDSTIHGIITKAEVAILKIARAISASFPIATRIRLDKLLITTTKRGSLAKNYLDKKSYRHSINSQWFRSINLANYRMEIQFCDGLSWVGACLPVEMKLLLPSQWTEIVESEISLRQANPPERRDMGMLHDFCICCCCFIWPVVILS
jgi:hypothetical protein